MLDSQIPNTSSTWQLWHNDSFDSDFPATLQASGTDIIQGLYQLWLHTLKEGVLDSGSSSFSRFHLTWGNTPAARVDILVNPFDNRCLLKLRRWANLMSHHQEAAETRDAILWRLAQLHFELLQMSRRWTSPAIDWNAEARELLARLEMMTDPEEL